MVKHNNTMRFSGADLARDGMCAALVFVSTRVLQFPIPLGYAHLGNAMILLASVFFGARTGALAGGLGSALADLTSYPEWTLPTLVIKTLMGLLCAVIAGPARAEGTRMRQLRVFFAVLAAIAEMVAGYVAAGAALYGSWAVGLSQAPGLLTEGAAGIALFYLLGTALERTGVMKYVGTGRRRSGP
ncbi:MAG: ECF transporter S component [Oscillospiraceae bacterium]|nr:ECF transporter S component [Oscillospiraceae bacterium]